MKKGLRDQESHNTENAVPLFDTKHVMESLRSSGHSFLSALGEIIDNSQEAGAKHIQVILEAGNGKESNEIQRVIVIDDGEGMTQQILPKVIALGSTTRFNSRKGIGRFGLGAPLGGISQARRIDYYSKRANSEVFHTFLDLDELKADQRDVIPASESNFPAELELDHLKHGTVCIWDKLELKEGDKSERSVKSLQDQVLFYVARTYRKFIEANLKISINGIDVSVWDPLFLMPNKRFPKDKPATLVHEESVTFKTESGVESEIDVRVTLLPEEFRMKSGDGAAARNPEIEKRKIHKNMGVSILRNNREIFFDPLIFVEGAKGFRIGYDRTIDRYVGVEIAFDAVLDEYFAVKHVKRGAEPKGPVKDAISNAIRKAVDYARKQVTEFHRKNDVETVDKEGVHRDAEEAAEEFEKTAPKGDAKSEMTDKEVEATIEAVAKEVVATSTEGLKSKEEVKKRIKQKPFSILGAAWPGREFVAIDHLGRGNAVIRLNHSHPFFSHVYQPVLRAAGYLGDTKDEPTQLSQDELKMIKNALDLLIVSYAKAEGWDETCLKCHEQLRLNWGNFLQGMIEELEPKK